MYRRRSQISRPKFGLVLGALPVRGIKARIKRSSIVGEFPTSKGTRATLRFESLIEADGLALFEVDPEVVLMAAQPHFLRYLEPQPNGSTIWRQYVPDLAICKADGSVLVADFKPVKIAAGRRWMKKSALIEEAYRLDHRVTFVTITDEMVRTEPRYSNAKLLLLHREVREDVEAKIAVHAYLERRGTPATLAEVRRDCRLPHPQIEVDRAFSALCNLVVDGFASIDFSKPIDGSSIVAVRPASTKSLGAAA